MLALAAQRDASDVLLIAGAPPMLRINGALTPAGRAALDAGRCPQPGAPAARIQRSRRTAQAQSVDLSFMRENLGRFRVNIHYQRGTLAASIRLLPSRIPSLESLHLPPTLAKLADARQGLVLVTGPTGCGKSSTLAALIDIINTRRAAHVVTIEDPVEYQHANRSADHRADRSGPRHAGFRRHAAQPHAADSRRDPGGRDARRRDHRHRAHRRRNRPPGALHAAHQRRDPGHVAASLIRFPAGNQPQIRQQLSLALAAVIAQQLVPGVDGMSRWPATEIMIATDAVRALIRKGDDHQLRSQISVGRAEGMMTMEQSLADLVRAGRITRETAAYAHGFRTDDLARYLA